MTNRYWFQRKTTGYGWTPITWEGWLVTLGCLMLTAGGIILGTAALLQRQTGPWLPFGCYAIAIVGLVLNIAAAIHAGEPRHRQEPRPD